MQTAQEKIQSGREGRGGGKGTGIWDEVRGGVEVGNQIIPVDNLNSPDRDTPRPTAE